MLFNSFEFIFVFLPVVVTVYFLLNRFNFSVAKLWLLGSSFFFYSWWNPVYLPLLVGSLAVNFSVSLLMDKSQAKLVRKGFLLIGILFNVGLLGYFKYADFFTTNMNALLPVNYSMLQLALPLAISFYTFQQIAYLVDSYQKQITERRLLDYLIFVSFFPQLIAGPIVHHKEMMPQFKDEKNRRPQAKNIALGIYVFSIGLFKKLIIADTFAIWANAGFNNAADLHFFDAWTTSFAYTFQLYFDFSGYTDMAIGAALLFNIKLPTNFNSPYKAVSIQDFWRRWHMTLTRFLSNYIYIPLGGSRKGKVRTYINILIVFLVSGFWHGAGWTFVLWGGLHGIAMVINRLWQRLGFRMYKLFAWFITFNFVNATWVFFRAENFQQASDILTTMVGAKGVEFPQQHAAFNWLSNLGVDFYAFDLTEDLSKMLIYLLLGFVVTLFVKNSIEMRDSFKPHIGNVIFIVFLMVYSVFNLQRISEFLYFNF